MQKIDDSSLTMEIKCQAFPKEYALYVALTGFPYKIGSPDMPVWGVRESAGQQKFGELEKTKAALY
jgi:hypothetical protein